MTEIAETFIYRAPTEETIKKFDKVKLAASELLAVLNEIEGEYFNREMAVAKTHLETSVMWANKSISFNADKEATKAA